MSANGDDEPRLREVAYRLFATEFDDADFSYSESDEERAPNYVVTPTGARVNRLFAVGVLTEIESVNQEVLRARIADPTGAFVVYAGQYQPEALAFLESAEPPLFVAVTGKARTFEPEDSDRVYTSIRPETISEVDASTRDRWVVQAAEQTVERIGQIASAKRTGAAGDQLRESLEAGGLTEAQAGGITLALDHYGTTGDYLQALRETALDAARVVAGERDEARGVSMRPGGGTDDPIAALADLDIEVATPAVSDEEPVEPATSETDATAVEEENETATPTAEADTSEAASTPDADPAEEDSTEVATAASTTTEESASEASTSVSEPATTSETARSTDTESAATDAPDPEPTTSTADATADESMDSAEETTPEPEPSTSSVADDASEPEPEPASTPEAETESTVAEATESSSSASTPNATAETSSSTTGETASEPSGEDDDDLGDFEPEFELDEGEREQIEEEFGTEFQSGTTVDDPGEADIETPDPEDLEAAAGEAESAASETPDVTEATGSQNTEPTAETAATESDAEPAADSEPATEAEPAADVDLEDAVMDAMEELNDGSGADREELVAAVVDQHGADPGAVEDAIQDALMGGRCYEPEDGKLTPI